VGAPRRHENKLFTVFFRSNTDMQIPYCNKAYNNFDGAIMMTRHCFFNKIMSMKFEEVSIFPGADQHVLLVNYNKRTKGLNRRIFHRQFKEYCRLMIA